MLPALPGFGQGEKTAKTEWKLTKLGFGFERQAAGDYVRRFPTEPLASPQTCKDNFQAAERAGGVSPSAALRSSWTA